MILYLAPGACSLADHIALHEAGLNFDQVKVDLKTHRTEDGRDLFGDFVHHRLLEALAYVSTEIHKAFRPYFTLGATEDAKASAGSAR